MKKKVFVTLLLTTIFSVAMIPLYLSHVEARTIIVDGDPSDWNGILPIATDPNEMPYDDVDLFEVYVTNDDDHLYIRMDVYGNISGTGGAYQVMVDANRNGTWDFQFGVISGWGYGYKMPTYESIPLNFSYSGSTVEMNASLLDLDFPETMDLSFLCSPYDSGYATSFYTVGSNSESITVDGDPADWIGSPFFLDDVGDAVAPDLDLYGCWVGDNGTDIFVMMNTSGPLDPGADGQVFIGDYMFMDTKGTVIEFSTSLADIGNPSEVYISGGIRSFDTYMDQAEATYAISKTTIFDVVVNTIHYPVSILSNSTVSDFNFNQTEMQISFNVTGDSDVTGYCNVTIPNGLLTDSPWTIKVDNTTIIDYDDETNDTHTFLYFTYAHENPQTVTIKGTWVIPEFPLTTILPLFIISSLTTLIFAKLKKKRQ